MTLVGGRVVRRQLTLLVAALAARSPVKVESAVVLIKSQWPVAKKILLYHDLVWGSLIFLTFFYCLG